MGLLPFFPHFCNFFRFGKALFFRPVIHGIYSGVQSFLVSCCWMWLWLLLLFIKDMTHVLSTSVLEDAELWDYCYHTKPHLDNSYLIIAVSMHSFSLKLCYASISLTNLKNKLILSILVFSFSSTSHVHFTALHLVKYNRNTGTFFVV